MKFLNTVLQLAAVSSAFVVPDEQLTNQIVIQSEKDTQTFLDRLQSNAEEAWAGVEETFKDAVAFSENAIDNAINAGKNAKSTFECHMSMTKFDMQGWLEPAMPLSTMADVDIFEGTNDKPHKPHRPHKPHHPHHGHGPPHKPNQTVYELIASSKYTTKLAKLINEYPDLVDVLNGTAANYTVFAPTDKAFEQIPKHHKPSKEVIKKILAYHVSPNFYPAGRVLVTHTIPTALGEDSLGGEPQRLRVGLGLSKGLNVNFYSRIVAINIVRLFKTPPCSTITNPRTTVRYERCHPRCRLPPPTTPTGPQNCRAFAWGIQHPPTWSDKDWSLRRDRRG
jgi:Fasciclin domain